MSRSCRFPSLWLAFLFLICVSARLQAQNNTDKSRVELLYQTVLGVNHPASHLQIEMRIVLCDVEHVSVNNQDSVKWVRDRESGDSSKALLLPLKTPQGMNTYFTVQVRNTGDQPVYLALIDLDAEHKVQPLFPEVGNDQDRIPAHSEWIPLRTRDGKHEVYQIDPPSGVETLLLLGSEQQLTFSSSFSMIQAPDAVFPKTDVKFDWTTASVTYRIDGNSQFPEKAAALNLEDRRALFVRSGNITRGANVTAVEDIVLNNLGDVFRSKSASDPGIQLAERQVAAFHARGDRLGEAEALHRLGLACAIADDNGRANACYEQALELERMLRDAKGEAATLADQALACRALSRQDQAIACCEKALLLWRGLNDTSGETVALNTEGQVYASLGEYAKSRDCYEQALRLAQKNNDPVGKAAILGNLGAIYGTLSQYPRALDYYAQALTLQHAMNDLNGEAVTLCNQGAVYAAQKDTAKARQCYEQALDAATHAHNIRETGLIRANLAGVYKGLKQYDKALEYSRQALDVARTVHNRIGEGAILHDLASIYSAMGDSKQAIAYYNQALPIRREVKDRVGEGYTLNNLMFAWKAQGNPRLSIYYGKQAVNAYQAIRANIQGMEQETQRSFLTPRAATYRTLADLLLAQGRLPEAQQALDMLKQEEYFDFVRRNEKVRATMTSQTNMTPTEAEQAKRYLQISDKVTAIGLERGQLWNKHPRTEAEEKQLTQLEGDLKIANLAFQQFLNTQLPQAFVSPAVSKEKITLLRQAKNLKSTLDRLGPGVVALYTLVGDEKCSLVLFTADAQVVRQYPIKAVDLRLKVGEFRIALTNPRLDPRPLAQELYKILVAPITQDLVNVHATTIMWSLDDVLRYLPVCALYDGKQYLLERYRNVVFTPASNAHLCDTPSPHWNALGLGVSKEEKDFPALPGVEAELKGIIASGSGAPSGAILPGEIKLDDAFTLASMETALHQRYAVVHIASHFQFVPGNENDSFLLLGKGEHLTLSDFETLPSLKQVELFALSACNTAMGNAEGADGHEVESFGALAQEQGAQAVLASLWPVEDNSTKTLMQQFYRNREARIGVAKVEALQQAQLALLRGTLTVPASLLARSRPANAPMGTAGIPRFEPDSQAPYSHPYYWAPFILIGNWR